jgi:mannitol/fructose-specific phosphotransferase system IIA component (Ntr-type)
LHCLRGTLTRSVGADTLRKWIALHCLRDTLTEPAPQPSHSEMDCVALRCEHALAYSHDAQCFDEAIMADDANRFGFPVIEMTRSATASPEAAVGFLISHLVQSGRLPAEHAARVTSQILHRESLGSTAIGRGVALPHSKSDVVDQVLEVIGRSDAPIVWPNALDSVPVHLVCLLVTPASNPGASLRALESVSRRLRDLS